MSTAPAGNSSDPPQRASHHAGTLAILTATAVGGVIATRINKAPLVLAAGAAALALMQKTRHAAAAPSPPSPPSPEPPVEIPVEIPVQSQVEQWLSQQISREEQAPHISLSDEVSGAAEKPEPEDDYRPQSLLYDDTEEERAAFTSPFFAQLTELPIRLPPAQLLPQAPVAEHQSEPPAYVSVAVPPAPETERPSELPPYTAFFAPIEPAPAASPEPDFPPPQPQVFAPAPSSLTVEESPPSSLSMEDAVWTLGVEPLPSLTEAAPAPFSAQASNMFFSAPAQVEESTPPPPVFSIPVFQGAAFPDEIDVMAPPEPVVHLTPTLPPDFSSAQEPAPQSQASPHEEISPTFAEELTRPLEASPPPAAMMNPFAASAPPPPPEEPAPEIPVQLAAPGEASFDEPLDALPDNPWKPQLDAPPTPYVSPFPFHAANPNPVVDAEIILRPRAPVQNSVTPKPKLNPHDFVKKDFAETFDAAPTLDADNTAPPEMPPAPREPRRRSVWRSWWRGD